MMLLHATPLVDRFLVKFSYLPKGNTLDMLLDCQFLDVIHNATCVE